jgi:hypothetical protein
VLWAVVFLVGLLVPSQPAVAQQGPVLAGSASSPPAPSAPSLAERQPLLGSTPAWMLDDPLAVMLQEGGDQATLEVRQPDVQWSPAGAARWVSIPGRQGVGAGDRVRSGPNPRAQLVYFDGTITDVGPETGILVQRLERSGDRNIVANLFQAVGSTISRLAHVGGQPADFQVETPAAIVTSRQTTAFTAAIA